jgi:hypothetical protein
MKQASMTADTYLTSAVECIDREMGKGFAKANPQLIAAFMQVTARDFHTAMMTKCLQELSTAISEE